MLESRIKYDDRSKVFFPRLGFDPQAGEVACLRLVKFSVV